MDRAVVAVSGSLHEPKVAAHQHVDVQQQDAPSHGLQKLEEPHEADTRAIAPRKLRRQPGEVEGLRGPRERGAGERASDPSEYRFGRRIGINEVNVQPGPRRVPVQR